MDTQMATPSTLFSTQLPVDSHVTTTSPDSAAHTHDTTDRRTTHPLWSSSSSTAQEDKGQVSGIRHRD